jgi:hypothetical protein
LGSGQRRRRPQHTYVTVDGGERTKELEFPLVQQVNQAAQLARYEIENAREVGPITLQLKPVWIGYKPGDCLTVDIDELHLGGPKTCIVIARSLDPATGIVTLTLVGETASKHSAALGQTTTAPPTTTTTAPDLSVVAAPGCRHLGGGGDVDHGGRGDAAGAGDHRRQRQ